jgi:hypothetical protein
MLNANEPVLHGADRNQLVELNRRRVTILGIPDQENHQKGHHRRSRIDDELPGIRKVAYRPRRRPHDDDRYGQDEGGGAAGRFAPPPLVVLLNSLSPTAVAFLETRGGQMRARLNAAI